VINLPTEFEFSNFTHYEHTKGDAKWGGMGVLRVTKGHSK